MNMNLRHRERLGLEGFDSPDSWVSYFGDAIRLEMTEVGQSSEKQVIGNYEARCVMTPRRDLLTCRSCHMDDDSRLAIL